jgi:hypothetical protein
MSYQTELIIKLHRLTHPKSLLSDDEIVYRHEKMYRTMHDAHITNYVASKIIALLQSTEVQKMFADGIKITNDGQQSIPYVCVSANHSTNRTT